MSDEIKCPKCGQPRQPDSNECSKCGIIFSKYEELMKRNQEENARKEKKELETEKRKQPIIDRIKPFFKGYHIKKVITKLSSSQKTGLVFIVFLIIVGLAYATLKPDV